MIVLSCVNRMRLLALAAVGITLLGIAGCSGATATSGLDGVNNATWSADRAASDGEETGPGTQGWITPPILDDKMKTGTGG